MTVSPPHFKNSNLLPYLVVTSECALQISYNRNYAICLRGEKYVSFFENLFDDACKRSNLMISTLGTITENLQYYYHEFVNRQSSPRWSCSCNPYFILYIDRPLLEKYLCDSQTVRRSFRPFCTIKTIGVPFAQEKDPYIDILPGKGWNISAAPVASGIHLIPSMRLWNRATVGRFFGAFVKTPILLAPVCCCGEPSVSFSSRLEITSFWDGSIAFSYELSNKYAILFLYEKSLSACFDDLFSYLMEGNLVRTLSETKAYLRQKDGRIEKTF